MSRVGSKSFNPILDLTRTQKFPAQENTGVVTSPAVVASTQPEADEERLEKNDQERPTKVERFWVGMQKNYH